MKKHLIAAGGAALLLQAPVATMAAEGFGTNISLGGTTFQTPVIPEPGLYYINYVNFYAANKIADGTGQSLVPNYQLSQWLLYNQFYWVPNVQVGDFQFAMGALIPIATVRQSVMGAQSTTDGLADITLQPLILGWKSGNFHITMLQGIVIPVGQYNPNIDVNLGRNTWQYQPQLSLGYIDPAGFELTATFTYEISSTNNDPMSFLGNPTGASYRSGQEFEVDFALGYNFTPQFEAGLTGYYYQQVTADKLMGDAAANAAFQETFSGMKGSVLAIGGGARFVTDVGEFYVQLDQEIYARYRTQGTSAWFRWAIKL